MVDTCAAGATVDGMSSELLIIVILVALVPGVGALGVLLTRRKITRRAGAIAGEMATGPRAALRDEKVSRVAEAYAEGAIDERTLGAAARVLGIDAEEARRRLEGAAQAGNLTTPRKPVDRDRKRKKNKQAKKSRQANRR
jgi:hypothetical protein